MRSEKNFNELYHSISTEVTKAMLKDKAIYENKRKTFFKNFCGYFYGVVIILVFIGFHMSYGSIKEMFLPFLAVAVLTEAGFLVLSSMIYPKVSRSINAQFKGIILHRIADAFGFNYSYKSPLRATDFTESGFDYDFDFFRSEDMLTGTLKNGSYVILSEILLTKEVTVIDDDGRSHVEERTEYDGVYAKVTIPNAYYALMELKQNDITQKFSKRRVEMESEEFEKKYDIIASDRLQALKVFSSDVIDAILKSDALGVKKLQIKIQYGNMYMRFPRKVFLEMSGEDKFMRKDIQKYYDEMGIIFDLIEKVTDSVIKNCELDRDGNV